MLNKKNLTIFIIVFILIIGLIGCSNTDINNTNNYTLVVEPKVKDTGTINIEPIKNSYKEGEEIILTANPAEGYVFSQWEGSGFYGEKDNPLKFKIMTDLSLLAVFVDDGAPGLDEIDEVLDPEKAPDTPTGLTATATSIDNNIIALSVDNPTDSANYMIYRSKKSEYSSAEPISEGLVNIINWTDDSIEAGNTYYYWVRVYDTTNNLASPLSNSSMLRIPAW